jgi:hypothetical protein
MHRSVALVAISLLGVMLLGCGKGKPTEQDAGQPNPDRRKPGKLQSMNNLKQLALAMKAYEETVGQFPTADGSEAGGPNQSWRVQLLPFMELGPLAEELPKLDEKARLAKMPKVFSAPGHSGEPGMTHYQVVVGPKTMFKPKMPALAVGISNVNGLTHTIMIVEAAEAVPWTSTKDLAAEEGKPLPRFFPGGFYAAFADAHVEFIPPAAKEETIRAMLDPFNMTPIKRDW